MGQSDLYYKKTVVAPIKTQMTSLLSPDRTEDSHDRIRTTESASNSPRNRQLMLDYVGAYNLSSSPTNMKRISPSMSPPDH